MNSFTKYIFAFVAICVLISFHFQINRKHIRQENKVSTSAVVPFLEVQTFATECGWGYTIYLKGKPYIRQDKIPAIEGNKEFANPDQALKVGKLVAYKIQHSQLPPSLSKHELDSLQVLY